MSTITYNDTIIPSATDASVLSEKVDVKLGANLLNVDDPNQRVGWAISSQGTIFQDTVNHYTDNCCVTDYIPVEASTAYHLSSKSGGLCNNYSICFYNKNKVWIGGQSLREEVGTGTNVFVEVTDITTPEGCAYIRTTYCTLVTIYGDPTTKAKRENIMINKGGAVPYEPYSIIGGYLVRSDVQNKDYTNSLTFLPYPARTDGTTNPSSWYAGYTVPLDGLYEAGYRSVRFRASTYTFWWALVGGIVYAGDEMECNTRDQEKEWDCTWFTLPITEHSTKLVASYGKTDPTVDNITHHIMFTPEVVYFETEGSSVAYAFPETFMPSKIYGVINEPFQIFNRSVVADINPYNWYHQYTCQQGREFARYFEITPQKVNNQIPQDLTISHSLKDANLSASTGKTSQLVLAEAPNSSSVSDALNILCIGASTTASGQWPSELKRILTSTTNTALLEVPNDVIVRVGDVYSIDNVQLTVVLSTFPIQTSDVNTIYVSTANLDAIPASGTLTWVSGQSDSTPSIEMSKVISKLPAGYGIPTNKLNFVGRKELGATTYPTATRPLTVNVEATGGWRWKTFYTPEPAVRFTVEGATGGINIDTVYKYNNSSNPSQEVKVKVVEVNIDSSGNGNIRFVRKEGGTNLEPSITIGTLTRDSSSGGPSTISYTDATVESYCPFPAPVEDGQITDIPDFRTYVDKYCSDTPNVLNSGHIEVAIFLMGTNNEQIFSEDTLTGESTELGKGGVIENMKFLLSGLHHDCPNCKVIIGTGSGFSADFGTEYYYGANSNMRTPVMLYWNRRYMQEVDKAITELNGTGTPWCFMANTVLESDSENIFPKEEKAVNLRMPDVKETIGTEGVHPELVGYQMVADSFYRCFVNTILN